jgi:soluble lytic murein transglycosylase-like protein
MQAYVIEQTGRLVEAINRYLVIPDGRDNYFGKRATDRLSTIASSKEGRAILASIERDYARRARAALEAARYSEAKDAANRVLRLTADSNTRREMLDLLLACYSRLPSYSVHLRERLIPVARAAIENQDNAPRSPTHRELAAELIFFGLYDEGAPELAISGFGAGEGAYSLAVYSNRGDHAHLAISYAEAAMRSLPQDYRLELLPRDLVELLYPAPFKDALNQFSRNTGVDARLILSIARQESRFNPSAKSVASARGLLQFIPETAIKMADKLEMERFELDQVYHPPVAIRLAVQYLADLFQLFPGSPLHVVASYNTGEDNVQRWTSRARSNEVDRLVVEIPIPETKDYVAKVMSSYWAYRQLYSQDLKPTS